MSLGNKEKQKKILRRNIMKVYFQNFGFHFMIRHKIRKILSSAFDEISLEFKGFSVNIALLPANEIQKLNKTFRDKDKPTDVLSFPAFELNKGENFNYKKMVKEINKKDGLISLGDIAICKGIAIEQAKALGNSFKRELCFLALHGFLHILGFNHLTGDDETEMNLISEKILNQNKVSRK